MKHFIIKLNQILKYNIAYIFLFICLIYTYNYVKNCYIRSKYSINSNELSGVIKNIKYKDKYTELYVDDLIINYYGDNDYYIGDIVYVKGTFIIPNDNTNFNLFSYKKYLYSNNIHYIVKINKIEKIKTSSNLFYSIKRKIYLKVNNSGSYEYLNLFILGNNNYIDNYILESYRKNGISHLFSISGMHISIFTSVILLILKRIIKNNKLILFILFVILIFYIFITNFSSSVIRASSLFLISMLLSILGYKVKSSNILIYIFIFSLIDNPYKIYNSGFLFSYVISFSLIHFNPKINHYKNYFIKLLITSIISYLISIPILINTNFSINLLTPFINLIFVPYVSLIIFPLSLLTFIFPFLEGLFNFLIYIMEKTSLLISSINFFNITLCHMSWIPVNVYYLIIYTIIIKLLKKEYKYIFVFLCIIFIHHNINYLNSFYLINYIDIGQGDTSLIIFPYNKKNILIDCANDSKNIIIPYLKSQGINKLDYLIITHGDFDHMGEAINLVNNFKVEKVIFNCGEYNDLEKELINVLDKKKIKYYSCIKELNIDKNKLYFLQTKEYDNENDNSNVIYVEIKDFKYLFMGDSGIDKEKDILDKYNLPEIDVLKVGHHGSKTSSSKEFINEINPKYSIISVGKNNRYGHPNKEVLNNLENSKIYRTDQDGSIMFKIKNNKLKIETCSP